MLNYQRVCSPTVHAIARLGAPSIPTPSYGRRGRILGPQQLLSLHLQRVAVQGQDGAFRQAALLAHKGDRPFETEKDHGDSWGIENWDYSHIYIYMIIHNYIIINYSICITYIITYIYMIWTDLRSPNLSHSLLFYQPVKSLRPSLETKASLTSPTGIRPQECHPYWWFMMPKYWFMMVNAG